MVKFIENESEINLQKEMVISINDVSIDELQAFQAALITALTEFNRNPDYNFESESYYIGLLLKDLQPSCEVLKTGFENTPKASFLRLSKPLTPPQQMRTMELINSFD